MPSPCGPNSFCQPVNQNPVCACLDNYVGSPPNCRAECTVNSDCSSSKACINQKCRDPCVGSCGLNTDCQVYQHAAICSCTEGYTGNPFESCHVTQNIGNHIFHAIFFVVIVKLLLFIAILFSEPLPSVYDKCDPSPCGANAACNDGVCTCIPNYFGNPYLSCRPECTNNADCATHLTCINNKCIDPCPNLCGQGANCDVYNHIPMCSCPTNTTGNSFFACTLIEGNFVFDNTEKIYPFEHLS